jgi:flagellar hook-length control protein FliK
MDTAAAAIPTQTSPSAGRAAAARSVGVPNAAGNAEAGAGFAAELRRVTDQPATEAESAPAAFPPDPRPGEPALPPPQGAPPLPTWPLAACAVQPQTECGATPHLEAAPPPDALAAENALAEDPAAIPTAVAAPPPQADGVPLPADAPSVQPATPALPHAAPPPALTSAETWVSAPLAAATPTPSARGQVPAPDTATAPMEGTLPTAERGSDTAAVRTSAALQLPSQQAASRGSGNAGPPAPRGAAHGRPADSAADATAPTRPIPQDTAPNIPREAQPAASAAASDAPQPVRGSTETGLAERPWLLPAATGAPTQDVAAPSASPFSAPAAQATAETPSAPTAANRLPPAPPPPPARQVAPIAIALALGTGGAPRLTVALEPEELGRVEIRVERGAEGENATVRIVAERPETLALLQRDARQLDRALQAAGIPLSEGGMQFSLAGREQRTAGEGGAKNSGGGGGGTASRERPGSADAALLDPARPPNRAGRLTLLDIAI